MKEKAAKAAYKMDKITVCYRILRGSAVTKVIHSVLRLLSTMDPICTALLMSTLISRHLFIHVPRQQDAHKLAQTCFYLRYLKLMDSQTVGAGFNMSNNPFVNIEFIHRSPKLISFYQFHKFQEGQLL